MRDAFHPTDAGQAVLADLVSDPRRGGPAPTCPPTKPFAGTDADERETLERVRAAVAAAMGPVARPARVIPIEALPLLASGKPDRAALRQRFGSAKN